MRFVACLLMLVACDRATPVQELPAPEPVKPDPVKLAYEAFQVLADDDAAGTSKLYSRSDFLDAGDSDPLAYDAGDFLGRLRTLFGARTNDEYVLLHRATGLVIVAYSAQSGPSFGGIPLELSADELARRTADDPVLAANPLDEERPHSPTPYQALAYQRRLRVYQRHLDDLRAGTANAKAVAELDALIASVSPADWSTTRYDEDSDTVVRIGAVNGSSFTEELAPAEAAAYRRRHRR